MSAFAPQAGPCVDDLWLGDAVPGPPDPSDPAHITDGHNIGFAGGLNLYAYVEQRPTGLVDPTGLVSVGEGLGTIARQTLQRVFGTQMAGGGPEDPVADVLTVGAIGIGILQAIEYMLKHSGPPKCPPITDERRRRLPILLYHYTSSAGRQGIVTQMQINPSTDPKYARYGPGQYFTDIPPAAESGMSKQQVARRCWGQPWINFNKISDYVQVDVSGLPITNPRAHVFLNPSVVPLNISNRLVRSGVSGYGP